MSNCQKYPVPSKAPLTEPCNYVKPQAPHNTFTHVPELLNPDFKAVKSPDIRFGVSKIGYFHGSLFTQEHFYLVFYSKSANNILVCAAANGFLCMLELG